MREQERFTKMVFGVLLIISFFTIWGKWLALGLGFLFLVSAAWGICWSCKVKKFLGQKTKVNLIKRSSTQTRRKE